MRYSGFTIGTSAAKNAGAVFHQKKPSCTAFAKAT
jgi:hypothetical protein